MIEIHHSSLTSQFLVKIFMDLLIKVVKEMKKFQNFCEKMKIFETFLLLQTVSKIRYDNLDFLSLSVSSTFANGSWIRTAELRIKS